MRALVQSFESFSSRGLLLFKQNYQESDLIVELLLERNLKISALVRGGQKSIKRFGGKLEPLKLLNFQLRAPKGPVTFERLFSLEVADLVEDFEEYRKSWGALSEGLFYLDFFRDISPRGELDTWLYPSSLKVMVAGNHLAQELSSDWRRLYVWLYFSKQAGYGLLGAQGVFSQSRMENYQAWLSLFEEELFSPKVVSFLAEQEGRVIEKKFLRDLYSDWMQRSHLKCKSLESWIMA